MNSLAELRRTEFPWSDRIIYLNHASTGPLPERTRLAVNDFNLKRTTPHALTDPWIFSMLDRCRELAARLINAEAAEIGLATNTTFGLAVAARMLNLEPGDVVLTSDREFPANVYPWMRLKELGVTLEQVPVTQEGWPDEDRIVERLGDPRVRVLAISLVQFSNGYQVDLARLSSETRSRDILFVLDAIQGIGQVPVDVRRTPVDILSCGAQKWLLSPWGSGFMYVRKELIHRLEPPITGWMAYEGTDDFTQLTNYREELRDNARRFEMITLPYQDFAGMQVSLELILEVGIENIARHIATLHQPLLDWAGRRGVRVSSPSGPHGSGILCLAPPGADRVQQRLREQQVIASLREGSIRISPHFYNSLEEIERVVTVLDSALA
jgi:cysteine desulfurase/selenocysteine lyase